MIYDNVIDDIWNAFLGEHKEEVESDLLEKSVLVIPTSKKVQKDILKIYKVIVCSLLLYKKRQKVETTSIDDVQLQLREKTNKIFSALMDCLKKADVDLPDKAEAERIITGLKKYLKEADDTVTDKAETIAADEEDLLKSCILEADPDPRFIYGFEDIPDGLVDLINGLLKADQDDIVLDYNCGYGNYCVRSMKNGEKTKEYISYSEDNIIPAIMRADAADLDNCSFATDLDLEGGPICTKAFIDNFFIPSKRGQEKEYSQISEVWDEFPNGPKDDDTMARNTKKWYNNWHGCGIAMYEANWGTVVALMPAGDLTLKSEAESREYLCKNGFIKGVIALPEKLFTSYWAQSYLVIFGKDNHTDPAIRFLDARSCYTPDRKNGKRVNVLSDNEVQQILNDYNDDDKASVVAVNDLSDGFNLNPMLYQKEQSVFKNLDYISLGDVITGKKNRGMNIKASDIDEYVYDFESDDGHSIKCIRPLHMENGVIIDHQYFRGDMKIPTINLCEKGDILISKTGYPFRVAVSDGEYLVIGNIYIIAVNESKTGISPEYIVSFLNTKAGQEEIRCHSSGSATPILNIAELDKLRIPVFEDEKQEELQTKSKKIIQEIKRDYSRLSTAKKTLRNLFCNI